MSKLPNLPTILTWLRIVLIPLVLGVYYLPWPEHTQNLWACGFFAVSAATDWFDDVNKKEFKMKDRINPNVVIQDAITGFSEPEFWGEYNIIEPDKSIENAINKIQKRLKKQE